MDTIVQLWGGNILRSVHFIEHPWLEEENLFVEMWGKECDASEFGVFGGDSVSVREHRSAGEEAHRPINESESRPLLKGMCDQQTLVRELGNPCTLSAQSWVREKGTPVLHKRRGDARRQFSFRSRICIRTVASIVEKGTHQSRLNKLLGACSVQPMIKYCRPCASLVPVEGVLRGSENHGRTTRNPGSHI